MIITDKRKKESHYFEELHYGDVFTYEGYSAYFMKTIEDNDLNAVDLTCGELSYFEEDDVVVPIKAELVIS